MVWAHSNLIANWSDVVRFLTMSRGNGCCLTPLPLRKFYWNFELLLESTSSETNIMALTKLWWSRAMLWKLWKIILNTRKVLGVDYFFEHGTGNHMLDFWFTRYFRNVVKILDNKSSSLDFSRKENVYWLELNRHWNSCPLEIKNSTIQNCNKNDILKFSV